jgi:hypothetical protein
MPIPVCGMNAALQTCGMNAALQICATKDYTAG